MTFVTNKYLVVLLRLNTNAEGYCCVCEGKCFVKVLPAMEKMIRVRVTKDAGVVVIMPMMEVTQ